MYMVGVEDSRGGQGPLEWVEEGVVLGHVLEVQGAQGILAVHRLSSGSEAEMRWLPWNLQRMPTWTKSGQYCEL